MVPLHEQRGKFVCSICMTQPGFSGTTLPTPLCIRCRTGIFERVAQQQQEQPKETTIVIGAPLTPAEILGRQLYAGRGT